MTATYVPCPASGLVMDDDTRNVITCPRCGKPYVTVEANEDGDPAIYPHASTAPQDRAVWLLAPECRKVASAVPDLYQGPPDVHDVQAAIALVDTLLTDSRLLVELARLASGGVDG